MSGILKPNVIGLGKEITLTNITYGNITWAGLFTNGLFDGSNNDINFAENYGWAVEADYIQFTTNSKINIWRQVSKGYSTYLGLLKIFKKDINGNFVDITSTINQVVTNLPILSWEKTISNLSAGTYRITGGGTSRIDGEWYIEENITYKYLIQNETNDLFTINNGLVNLATQTTSEALYLASGFNDIILLNGTTFNQTKTMVDEGIVGTGKMFSVEIDISMIKNVNIT
jgi:hypothetical protein